MRSGKTETTVSITVSTMISPPMATMVKTTKRREERGREGSGFRETDMMTIMSNTDCSLRHTQHTNRPTQEYTPAHTPHLSSYSAWLHTHENTLTHIVYHSGVVTSRHTYTHCRHNHTCNHSAAIGDTVQTLRSKSFADEKSQISAMCV